jgi:hypothetical protein
MDNTESPQKTNNGTNFVVSVPTITEIEKMIAEEFAKNTIDKDTKSMQQYYKNNDKN